MHNDFDKIKNFNTTDNENVENKIENIKENSKNTQIVYSEDNNKEISVEKDNLNGLLQNKRIKITNVTDKVDDLTDKVDIDKVDIDKVDDVTDKVDDATDKVDIDIDKVDIDIDIDKVDIDIDIDKVDDATDKVDIDIALSRHGYNKNISTFIRIKDHYLVSEITKRSLHVNNKTYYADQVVIGPDQRQIFDLIRPIILEKAIKGYNCSIFAYGQTGSGKTYTIQGTKENPGIIVQTLVYLHERYNSVRFSFVEIYNEQLIDLFDPERTIAIREDSIEGVVVSNSTIIESDSVERSMKVYGRGLLNRRTASTEMNATSSRSHCIFTIFLGFLDYGMSKKSRLCIVDLAGSEKYRESVYERIKEMCNINKSLLCLGKIVNKLSNRDGGHISYRDSKLTFILKDALGGNSKLAIIGNVSLCSVWDTVNTLMFLQRAKLLNNNPLINYGTFEASVGELMENLKMLDEENDNLKEENKALQKINQTEISGSGVFIIKELEKDVKFLKNKLLEMKKIIGKLNFENYNEKRKILLEINKNLKKNEIEKDEIINLLEKREI